MNNLKELKKYGKVELQAYQYNSKTVRIRAIFESPKHIDGVVVRVTKERGNIIARAELRERKVKSELSEYDESYLNELLKEKKSKENKVVKAEIKDDVFFQSSSQKKVNRVDPLANPERELSSDRGMSGYVMKFLDFY